MIIIIKDQYKFNQESFIIIRMGYKSNRQSLKKYFFLNVKLNALLSPNWKSLLFRLTVGNLSSSSLPRRKMQRVKSG